MGPLLRVENVKKIYQGVTALNDVSFTVEQGDIVGLIGPNGAGKTTLLSCISGTQDVSSGDIFFRGNSIRDWPIHKRTKTGIGRTFQIVQPFKSLTVYENVLIPWIFTKKKKKENKNAVIQSLELVDIIRLFGLSKKEKMHANELDLPEQKRLEFARALATNAELLLLDEVMAGLNRVEMTGILDLIQEINQKGMTIILVEHVLKAVVRVSKRIVVLQTGKKIAEGAPREVLVNEQVRRAYIGTDEKEAQS